MSGPERERGSPFLVPIEPGGDGRAWLGCLEWEAGAGDRIVVRELQPDGRVARELPVQDAPAEIVRPVGVLDRLGRLCVVWTEPVDGVAQLRLARLERTRDAEGREREGFTPARSLTSGRDPNRNVEAVRHSDGRVWLAWESHRGSIDVVVAPLSDDGCLGEAQVLGDGRFSDVDPVIASRGSKLEVAWSQYQGRDYEIVLRAFDPARGERGETLNVTQDGSSDDLHPALAVAPGGDLWLAWDRLVDSTRGSSMPETQRPAAREQHDVFVMTARVRGDHVELPAAREGWPAGAVAGAPRFSWMGGVPRLAIGGDGRPWIAYRYLLPFALGNGRKYYGEPVLVHRFGDDGWSLATEIGDSLGFAEEPALAASSSGVLCAGQQDRRERAATLYDGELAPAPLREALAKQGVDVNSWFGPTGIFVTRLDRAAAGDPDPVAFVERPDRRAPQHFHPSGDALDDPIVSGASHLEVTRKSQRFTVYWGDLHRHSSISRCAHGFEPTPLQRYEFGRDVHLYDFMAMTDHAGQIDPFSWWQLDKMTWLFRSPSYCPLAGFECSTQWYGHQNVILDGRLTPLFAWASSQKDMDAPRFQGLDLLYSRLTEDHAITVPHTSADTGRRVPWEQCDPRFCKLVEVYQAQRGNYEFEGCLRQSTFSGGFGSYVHDALQAGWKLGFVASTDHGNGASYAGALAERLEPRSLFEALKSRRTFGATVKGLFVDFRVDDALMGEEVACSAPPKVHVTARAPQELAELVVFRDGKPWKSLGRAPASRPDSAVGATLVLEPPFKAKPPEKDWVTTFTVDDGEWLAWPLGRRPPQGEKKGRGFSLDPADPHVLRFEWPAGYVGFRPGEMRVRLRAHRDGRVKIDLDGDGRDAREVRVGAMLAHAINGSLGNQSWTLTSYERYDDVVQLDPGLGVRELDHEWIDDELEPGASWYYARITQRDGEMAWSSPIYVSRQ